MEFSGAQFCEKIRWSVQGGFFALFLTALAFSLSVRGSRGERLARLLWCTALLFMVAMWCGGAGIELMERAQRASAGALMVAIGAFSILLGGIFSLVSEWFKKNGALDGNRIAWTLLLLTFAGWFFGGVALPQNEFFETQGPASDGPSLASGWLPNGWILALCGAQLLGAAQLVQSPHEPTRRVINVAPATWWLLGFSILLWLPNLGASPLGASVLLAASGFFLVKIWPARRLHSRRMELIAAAIAFICGAGCLAAIFSTRVPHNWERFAGSLWQTPIYNIAFALLVAQLALLLTKLRQTLHVALSERFAFRALLVSTLVGFVVTTLFFGPGGALFFAFFPLAGLFFDLLRPDESFQSAALREVARHRESKAEEAVGVSVNSGRTEAD